MLGFERHSPSKPSDSRPNISSRLHQHVNIIFVAHWKHFRLGRKKVNKILA